MLQRSAIQHSLALILTGMALLLLPLLVPDRPGVTTAALPETGTEIRVSTYIVQAASAGEAGRLVTEAGGTVTDTLNIIDFVICHLIPPSKFNVEIVNNGILTTQRIMHVGMHGY